MGCASSKGVDVAAAAAYRPPPSSVALFDISTVQEPWLMIATNATSAVTYDDHKEQKEAVKKQMPETHFILEKLDAFEHAPHTWSEVSKALEDLKPIITQVDPPEKRTAAVVAEKESGPPPPPSPSLPELENLRPVSNNSFLVRDRHERVDHKKSSSSLKPRGPFEGFLERKPPGNEHGVVLYTTTLRGVRRTFEACETARRVVEACAVAADVGIDVRDVALHGEYLKELKELSPEGEAGVPTLFVAGRYIGGAEKMVGLVDQGRLTEMFKWVSRRHGGGGGARVCDGCGGARFVPCLDCHGSCKIVEESCHRVVKCRSCNENGLAMCPLCH